MNKLLEQALELVRRLPAENQDQIARIMLDLACNQAEPRSIDPTHLPDVLESLVQAERRHFATDSEIEAAFRRFDR
jgi:DNA-binding transcriptional regulator YdaS (Cro superfamily)